MASGASKERAYRGGRRSGSTFGIHFCPAVLRSVEADSFRRLTDLRTTYLSYAYNHSLMPLPVPHCQQNHRRRRRINHMRPWTLSRRANTTTTISHGTAVPPRRRTTWGSRRRLLRSFYAILSRAPDQITVTVKVQILMGNLPDIIRDGHGTSISIRGRLLAAAGRLCEESPRDGRHWRSCERELDVVEDDFPSSRV